MTQRFTPNRARLFFLFGLAAFLAFLILELRGVRAGFRDYDEGVYWMTLRAMGRGDPLYRTIFASEPPVFFYGLLPFSVLGHSIAAIRVGVLGFAVVGLGAAYAAGRSLGGPVAGGAAVALVATSPFYLDQATVLQSDVPSLALALLAVAISLVARGSEGRRRLLLAAFAGFVLALSVGTKLSATLVAIPLLLILATSRGARMATLGAAVAGGMTGTVLILIPIAGSWQAAYQQMVHSHLGAAQTLQRPVGANLPLLFLHRGLPLEVIAALGAASALWRRDRRALIPLAWAIVTAAAILLYQPLFVHHLVQLVPPLALLGALGLANLPWPGRLSGISAVGGVGLLLAVMGYGASVGIRHTQAQLRSGGREASLAAALRQASRPGEFIISDNPYVVALADRDIPPEILDPSHQVVAAGLLTVTRLEAAADRYHVRLVLTDGDRLESVPGFREWLSERFGVAWAFGAGTAIYERRTP